MAGLALAGLVLALAAVALAGACGGRAQVSSSPTAAPSGRVVLTVSGPKGTLRLTMKQLRAMPAVSGYGGIKDSVGVITPPVAYEGVRVADVASLVGGLHAGSSVTLVGSDGYGMTFSYAQIMRSRYTTYDMATGTEEPPHGALSTILAYAQKGKPLGPDQGPLRLVVVEPSAAQVVDGHWTVKWIDKLVVGKAEAPFRVSLVGAVAASLDGPTFINCSSPGCHGAEWVDPQGHQWFGVPFYLVSGLVDDHDRHGAGAYNARLARKGYAIQIEGADGKVVTISSRQIADKRSVLLASRLDGRDLPAGQYPLRLVGPGLTAHQMPGRIVSIVLRVK
jgi:DMSO/TMAO reductase YedYZ molybdopterin-dependent catalytic subunit